MHLRPPSPISFVSTNHSPSSSFIFVILISDRDLNHGHGVLKYENVLYFDCPDVKTPWM
uniref:Uncharacterized protein n=1 Tax=Helianthus annuus TaxID=4232 RepID=A0A251VEB7_HELAN